MCIFSFKKIRTKFFFLKKRTKEKLLRKRKTHKKLPKEKKKRRTRRDTLFSHEKGYVAFASHENGSHEYLFSCEKSIPYPLKKNAQEITQRKNARVSFLVRFFFANFLCVSLKTKRPRYVAFRSRIREYRAKKVSCEAYRAKHLPVPFPCKRKTH